MTSAVCCVPRGLSPAKKHSDAHLYRSTLVLGPICFPPFVIPAISSSAHFLCFGPLVWADGAVGCNWLSFLLLRLLMLPCGYL